MSACGGSQVDELPPALSLRNVEFCSVWIVFLIFWNFQASLNSNIAWNIVRINMLCYSDWEFCEKFYIFDKFCLCHEILQNSGFISSFIDILRFVCIRNRPNWFRTKIMAMNMLDIAWYYFMVNFGNLRVFSDGVKFLQIICFRILGNIWIFFKIDTVSLVFRAEIMFDDLPRACR